MVSLQPIGDAFKLFYGTSTKSIISGINDVFMNHGACINSIREHHLTFIKNITPSWKTIKYTGSLRLSHICGFS